MKLTGGTSSSASSKKEALIPNLRASAAETSLVVGLIVG